MAQLPFHLLFRLRIVIRSSVSVCLICPDKGFVFFPSGMCPLLFHLFSPLTRRWVSLTSASQMAEGQRETGRRKKRPRDARWKYHGGEEGRAGIEKGARGGYGDASVDRGGEEESSMKAA